MMDDNANLTATHHRTPEQRRQILIGNRIQINKMVAERRAKREAEAAKKADGSI